jgi:hypothetical protein
VEEASANLTAEDTEVRLWRKAQGPKIVKGAEIRLRRIEGQRKKVILIISETANLLYRSPSLSGI